MGEGLEALEWPNAEALNDCDNLRSRPETMLMLVVLILTCPVVDSRLRRKERKMHRAAPNWVSRVRPYNDCRQKGLVLLLQHGHFERNGKEKSSCGWHYWNLEDYKYDVGLGAWRSAVRQTQVTVHTSSSGKLRKALAGTNHDGDDKSQGITNYDGS